jgi:hypothetical protein
MRQANHQRRVMAAVQAERHQRQTMTALLVDIDLSELQLEVL